MTTTPVCRLDRLVPERGVAVLVGGHQVALFRVTDPDTGQDRVHAVSHRDPFSGAHVMARGIVGSSGERVTVASPMYKQVFDLVTGACLTEPGVRLDVWPTRIVEGLVHVAVRPSDQTDQADPSGRPADRSAALAAATP